jgi:1,4-dihydroxy-2-naphthoyl-CoA hydrolase
MILSLGDGTGLPFSKLAFIFGIMSNQPENPASRPSGAIDLTASSDGDFAAAINARLDGWNAAMGLHFVLATPDEVTAELEIGPRHRQAYGIVHGGVYSGIVETVSSVAAALWARRHNQTVVGVENHTSFLNAVREGKLTVTARPLMRGRRTQVWQATVTDAAGRTAAEGKVRLLSLEAGAALAGEQVQVKSSQS